MSFTFLFPLSSGFGIKDVASILDSGVSNTGQYFISVLHTVRSKGMISIRLNLFLHPQARSFSLYYHKGINARGNTSEKGNKVYPVFKIKFIESCSLTYK